MVPLMEDAVTCVCSVQPALLAILVPVTMELLSKPTRESVQVKLIILILYKKYMYLLKFR